MQAILRFLKNEKGQGLAEYALILVLVSIVAIVTLRALGTSISSVLGSVVNEMNP
ncbi:MAG TPA: Flp family type IVb pilin [Blastocatellia bacterium]|nr:Flp family type IVb pilin [Blastocatellia bacterium]